ncbi:MAG: Ig-like domain-containing protein [Patescibacteria group bacterium]|nr:Ig-like domain-containing protein [Patescibacteria group bacterium]
MNVDLDSCAFSRPDYCSDPDNDGFDECPMSTCDEVRDRCRPVINSILPDNGPPGQPISIEGCYFRAYDPASSYVQIGGDAGNVEICENGWTNELIIAEEPGNPNGSQNLIDVNTSTATGGLSTAIDSLQNDPAVYGFDVTGNNCARICTQTALGEGYNFCDDNGDCASGNCMAPQPIPAAGLPVLCPPLSPKTGEEGDLISMSGSKLAPVGIPGVSGVQFSPGLIDTFDDIIARVGSWAVDGITRSEVQVGASSGGVHVVNTMCPSNPLPFKVKCNSNADCTTTNCCRYDGGLGYSVCVDAAECATGVPGDRCQLPSNIANNGTCSTGAELDDIPEDYLCIDTARHQAPTPPNSAAYPPVGENDCTVCCDPDQDNDGDMNDEPGGAMTLGTLKCTPDVWNCTAPGNNERGLYCGCDEDSDCGDVSAMGCGFDDERTDHCCYPRPEIAGWSPSAATQCRNISVTFTFSQSMDWSTFVYGDNTVPETTVSAISGGSVIPGKLTHTDTSFTFTPDEIFDPSENFNVWIATGRTTNTFGVAIGDNVGVTYLRGFNAGNRICTIDHLKFQWWDGAWTRPSPSYMTCSTSNCAPGDHPATPPDGYQQFWSVQSVSEDGTNLISPAPNPIRITWKEDDPKNVFTPTHNGSDIVPPNFEGPCPAESSNSLACLLTSDNASGRGRWVVTADGSASTLLPGGIGKVTDAGIILARMCSSPWPNILPPTNDDPAFEDSGLYPKLDNSPFPTRGNNNYVMNFSTWYCRDGTDLPLLASTDEVIVTEADPATVNLNDGIDSKLKSYLFVYPGTCSIAAFTTETTCVEAGASWTKTSDDAIGILVFENEGGKSLREWYQLQLGYPPQQGQGLTIDGYPAIRDGTTVYVNATNLVAGRVYTNIYLMSYHPDSSAQTIDIFNRMLDNWEFNVNLLPGQKESLQRDIQRVGDLDDIWIKLLEYKAANGHYPLLEGGSYINGMSTSRWPSWQEALGDALGGDLPVDPLNTYEEGGTECTEADGYNQETCWDDTDKAYQCPDDPPIIPDSYIYLYITNPTGEIANLYANMEYTGPEGWVTVPPVGDPCSGIANADCACVNYARNIVGSAADRTGPEITGVDSLVRNGVTVLSGTRALDVSASDAESGVDRVEFYVDGVRTYTDSDGTDGPPAWVWNFNTTGYTDAEHTVLVIAYDTLGNWSSISYRILIDNGGGPDGTTPYIELKSPVGGSTVFGAAVVIDAFATDNRVVDHIEISIDGVIVRTCNGTEGTLTCQHVWDTTAVLNGAHTLAAVAYDQALNTKEVGISVTVNNDDPNPPNPVAITEPADGATISDDVDVRVHAVDDRGIARVDVYIDNLFLASANPVGGDDFIAVLDTQLYENGSHDIDAYAFDLAGNSAAAAGITVSIDNPEKDETPPTVVFIPNTPADGTAVDGVADITVDAFDEIGVTRVNFYVDYLQRATLGGAACQNPAPACNTEAACEGACASVWAWTWPLNTLLYSDGWHTIQADALDAAGNRSASIEIRVNVRGEGAPSITMGQVSPCSAGSGTLINFGTLVTDADGIGRVDAIIQQPDGAEILRVGLNDVAPVDNFYTGTWDSTGYSGAFYVDYEAEDGFGNVSRMNNAACVAVITPP